MILATPRLQATSRGGGKSGIGCGKAPPRAEFMPHAGTIEVVRKVTSVSNATIEGFCRDKERNERLIMPTSWIQSKSWKVGVSDMPPRT